MEVDQSRVMPLHRRLFAQRERRAAAASPATNAGTPAVVAVVSNVHMLENQAR
jgi:hypothetical protein